MSPSDKTFPGHEHFCCEQPQKSWKYHWWFELYRFWWRLLVKCTNITKLSPTLLFSCQHNRHVQVPLTVHVCMYFRILLHLQWKTNWCDFLTINIFERCAKVLIWLNMLNSNGACTVGFYYIQSPFARKNVDKTKKWKFSNFKLSNFALFPTKI